MKMENKDSPLPVSFVFLSVPIRVIRGSLDIGGGCHALAPVACCPARLLRGCRRRRLAAMARPQPRRQLTRKGQPLERSAQGALAKARGRRKQRAGGRRRPGLYPRQGQKSK